MSLVRRVARSARKGEERALPSMTLAEYAELVLSGASVTRTSVQNPDTALRHSVVYRCVDKAGRTLASFPIREMNGRRVMPTSTVIREPSPGVMRQSVWVQALTASLYLRGNAFGFVSGPDPVQRRLSRIDLLNPDTVELDGDGRWLVDGEEEHLWPAGRLWHVPLFVLPGSPLGLNPLSYARHSLFTGMAAQEFGGNFFRDGGHPSGILAPERDPGPDGATRLKQAFQTATEGTSRAPAVLPQHVKWIPLSINPEDSQFLETIRATDEQICRFFGMPPEEVGVEPSGNSRTYANREQRKQDFLADLLMPVRRIEEALSELIPRPREVRFQTAGLLRADTKARYESYLVAAKISQLTGEWFLTPDEMRELEDRGPVPEGTPPPPAPSAPASTDTEDDDDEGADDE